MSIAKAADDLKLLAKKLKPLQDVAAVLEGIASLDNATAEAEARQVKAYDDANKAALAFADACAEVESAEAKLASVEAKAVQIVDDATAKADKIYSDAKAVADEIVAGANLKRISVESKVRDMEVFAGKVQVEVEAKKKELEDLKAEIASMRTRFLSLVK